MYYYCSTVISPCLNRPRRKRRWFSIPGKTRRTPDGRFLRLKLPPYRFHFKKYSDPPRGWDSFFFKNGVGTRFFDLQSLARWPGRCTFLMQYCACYWAFAGCCACESWANSPWATVFNVNIFLYVGKTIPKGC